MKLFAATGDEVRGIDLFLPPLYDIVGSAIVLAVIVFVMFKFIMPKMNAVLDERSQKIEEGLKLAESAKADAEQAQLDYQKIVAEARSDAAKIREDAKADGEAIRKDLREKASADAERILSTAQKQIHAEQTQAAESLRKEIGSLATELAEKIVGESLTDDARQSRLVDNFLAELEENAKKEA